MTIISKASLAAELGISKARVSQYLKRGLPVRSDGKLDRESAVKWIADNHADYRRERERGVNRASELARTMKPKKLRQPRPASSGENPVDAALLNGVAEIVARSAMAARLAAQALGLPVRTAYLLSYLVQYRLSEDGEAFLDRVGAYRHEDKLGAAVGPLHWSLEPDWAAQAEASGEPFDEDAWDRAAQALVERQHA